MTNLGYPIDTGIRELSNRGRCIDAIIEMGKATTSQIAEYVGLNEKEVEQAMRYIIWRTSERLWTHSIWWDYNGTEREYVVVPKKISSPMWRQNYTDPIEGHPFNWDWCRVGSNEYKQFTK